MDALNLGFVLILPQHLHLGANQPGTPLSKSRRPKPSRRHTIKAQFQQQYPSSSSSSSSSLQSSQTPTLPFGRIAGGTWGWGNRLVWNYTPSQDTQIEESFNILIQGGCRFFDTGDSYGTGALDGRAETLLGEFRSRLDTQYKGEVLFGTKLASYPWRWTRKSLEIAARNSRDRMYPNGEQKMLDYAMMHWSPHNYLPWQEKYLLDAFAGLVQNGYAREIGLSNVGPKRLAKIHEYLAKEHGVRISVVQQQFSLLSRLPETSGLMELAKDLGIPVLGYSPLALGFLSGKFFGQETSKLSGPRGFVFRNLRKDPGVQELVELMKVVARSHGSHWTTSDVALAWVRAKGATPLVGVRNPTNARQFVSTLHENLYWDEVDALDAAASKCRAVMVQNIFQTE